MSDKTSSLVKVLIAEDEPSMLSLLAGHMRSLGYSVVEASDGDGAWELAQRHHPDLVMLDVMMPGMSGWEVCKRVKGHPEGAFGKTGVIMLTGIGENLNDMTSPLFAADGWLNKPFDFKELDALVRETLDTYGKHLPEGSEHATKAAQSAPAPRKTASKKAAPKKAAAKRAAPKKTAAKKAASKKTAAPKRGAAKKAASKKTAAPKRGAAKKAASKKTAAPKRGAAKKAAPKRASAKKAAPKKGATRR